MKKKILVFVLFFSSFLLKLISCNRAKVLNETQIITDLVNNEIVLPKKIERVAALSATCESAIIGLGLADKLVYSSSFNDSFIIANEIFPELKKIKKTTESLSAEEMLALDVQVVFVKSKNYIEKLSNAGLKVVYLDLNTVDGTKSSISLLGRIFGIEERANKCISYIDRYTTLINQRMSSIEEKGYYSAYYARTRSAESNILYTYGPEHISSSWARCGGAKFITEHMDLSTSNGILTEEELIANNPDIIFICGYYQNQTYNDLFSGKYNGILNAVDNKKVFKCPIGVYDWGVGGIEYALTCIWCAKTLHPELFEDIDFISVIKQFYNDVANVIISDSLAEKILNGIYND